MSLVVIAPGHSWVAATCTTDGYCSVCEAENEEDLAFGHAGYEADFKCDNCSAIMLPEEDSTLTIEQALALGSLYASNAYTPVKYYVTGWITQIYNTQYGNMYITDGVNTLTIYGTYSYDGSTRFDALATKPAVYDEITVYGIIGQYNGTPQMKNGWIDEIVTHVCSEFTVATCEDLAECVICGKTTGELAPHSYVDGVCGVCGHEEGGVEIVRETATMSYTTATTTNMTGNNDAATLNLDASLFSVIGNKGSTNNNCGLNKAGQIRLYGYSSTGNGSYFTVTIADGYTIDSIKITFTNTTNNKNCQLTVDGVSTTFDGSAKTWEMDINSDSFKLQNVIKGSTTQIYIASIEITYHAN